LLRLRLWPQAIEQIGGVIDLDSFWFWSSEVVVGFTPQNLIFGMIANFDFHFATLPVTQIIRRVITENVTLFDACKNLRVNVSSERRFFEISPSSAGLQADCRQRSMLPEPFIKKPFVFFHRHFLRET